MVFFSGIKYQDNCRTFSEANAEYNKTCKQVYLFYTETNCVLPKYNESIQCMR